MNKFESKFLKTLDEDIGLPPEDVVSAEGDAEAYADSFEEEGGEDAFNANPAMAGYEDRYKDKVKAWKRKIREFVDWLNDPEHSLNQELDDLDAPGTPFEGVSKDSAKKITSIAQDLGALEQILNGVVFSSNQKKKEAENAFGGDLTGSVDAPVEY